jgi:hypothetical protein
MSARQLHFNAFIWPNGYHESAWRVVDDDVRGVLGLPTTPRSPESPSAG